MEQDVVADIENLRRLAENDGPIAVSAYIDNNLNRWRREQVAFAITGRTATGKSTFINKIRNVTPADDGFASTGSGNTTVIPTLYRHPTNDQITFYDLPGYASTIFKKEDYINEMNISDYHFIFILFSHVLSEDEIWLVGELLKLGKPFALVRTKIDIDIDNAIADNKDREMIIPEIRERIQIALIANPELADARRIFLISSRNIELGEWSDLITYVGENIDGFKAQALLFSLDCFTKEIVERKYQMLKKRREVVTVLAASVAFVPLPGLDVAFDIALLIHEVNHYMSVFGVNPRKVNSLIGFDRSLLKCKDLLEPNVNMALVLAAKIQIRLGVLFVTSVLSVILSLVGSVISAASTAMSIYQFLGTMLHDVKHDALLIYEHIANHNADHRM